jgi:hypothetical protein
MLARNLVFTIRDAECHRTGSFAHRRGAYAGWALLKVQTVVSPERRLGPPPRIQINYLERNHRLGKQYSLLTRLGHNQW